MSFARPEIDCESRNEFRYSNITAVESVFTRADAFRIVEQFGQIRYFTAEHPTIQPDVSVAKLKAGAILAESTLEWTLDNIRFHGRRLGIDLHNERVKANAIEVERPSRVEAYNIAANSRFSYHLPPGTIAAVAGIDGEVWLSTSRGEGRLLETGDVAYSREGGYDITPLAGKLATVLFIAGQPTEIAPPPTAAA
jgi:hypothetical protein